MASVGREGGGSELHGVNDARAPDLPEAQAPAPVLPGGSPGEISPAVTECGRG